MIPVDRNRMHQGSPVHPGAAWQAIATTATALAVTEGAGHEAKATVYGDDRVRAALEMLTNFKCSYCEVSIARTDWDIEHFRPKGRVKGRPDHPGYYWLAYEWTNLLPSCTHCNQNRREKPVFGEKVAGDTGGKVDQFPLADEAMRAMDPAADLALEAYLILNPFDDDPADHLGYLPNGEIFALNGSPRGKASILVFRLDLVRMNLPRLAAIEPLPELLGLRKSATMMGLAAVVAQVDAILDKLTADSQPFAGIKRYFIKNPAALGIAG